jgi:uncharacterized UBP type Zn finger protein
MFQQGDMATRVILFTERGKAFATKPDPVFFEYLGALLERDLDCWNLFPEQTHPNLPDKVGLKNIGSTCYMTAICQQLFAAFLLAFLIATGDLKDDASQIELRRKFTNLAMSQQPFPDVQPFCSVWKCWQNVIMNPTEKQDACGFPHWLLDRLSPHFRGVFTCGFQHAIRGMTEGHM